MTRKRWILIAAAALTVAWLGARLWTQHTDNATGNDLAQFGPYRAGMSLREGFESLPPGERVGLEVLPANPPAWLARWRLLAQTRDRLDISYFIVRADIFGAAFIGHILQKAEEGVRVRLLFDAQGTSMSKSIRGNDYLDALANTRNIELKLYRPLINRYIEAFAKLNPVAALASEHDKILVSDGRRGMIGGRNIAAEYFAHGADMPKAFRDMDVVLEGRGVAKALTRAFEAQYGSDGASRLPPETVDLVTPVPDLLLAYRAMDAWLNGKPLADDIAREIAQRRLPWQEELAKYPKLRGLVAKTPTHVVRAETRLLDSRTRLEAKGDAIGEALVRLTRSARNHILIQSPYLVLSEEGVRVLEDAGKRGVKLTILTNSPLSSDNALSQAFFLEQWPEIMARVPGLRILVSGEPRTLHTKLMIFDDQVTVVGTYNLDPISMAINSEIMAAVWSEEFARAAVVQPNWLMRAGAPTVYEYRIRRDAKGRPLRDANNKPLIAFGPQQHSSPESWKQVQVYWKLLQAAEQVPGFSPIF